MAYIHDRTIDKLLNVVEAAKAVRHGVISSGSGPAAPIFDRYDYAVERNRGRWHTVEGTAMDDLKAALDALEED